MLRILTVLLLVCSLSSPLFAQAPPPWVFQEGETFYIREAVEISQSIVVLGQTQTQKSEQTTIYSVKVNSVTEDGTVNLEMKIDSIAGVGYSPEGITLFKKMQGAPFEITLGPDRKVKEFVGFEDFLKRVGDGNEQQQRLFRTLIGGEEGLKASLTQPFTLASEANQENWQSLREMRLGPFGRVIITQSYTPAGVVDVQGAGLLKVNITAKSEYIPPQKDIFQLPFEVVGGELKPEDFEGTAWYDPQTGKLANLEISLDLRGTLAIEVAGQTEDVKLSQKQKVSVKLTDSKP